MARGGARPGAGRPAGKSANTSPPARARARARDGSGNQRPWPADKVERWPIDRLIPYAKNARTHSPAQIAALSASVKEWGWTTPVLVAEDRGLIAGHARILAARQLGIAEIPVMVAAGWSEAQKRAYVLADNQLAITVPGGTRSCPLDVRRGRAVAAEQTDASRGSTDRPSATPEALLVAHRVSWLRAPDNAGYRWLGRPILLPAAMQFFDRHT
jgi:hypothetical protein